MPKSNHIKVLLVRSGPNDWDRAGRLSGSADLPLSADGAEEIRRLAVGFTPGCIARVCCAPEESAQVTADIIAHQVGAKAKIKPGLHEIGVGRWEGMAAADAEGRYGSTYRQWREDPTGVVPPGGEMITDAAARIIPEIRDVLARCKADDSCGVCFVLRPMAFGLVRCWLRGEELSSLWEAAETEEGHEWFLVDRSLVRSGGLAPGAVRDAI
jgi:broad specificity phosphatase PhoE